MQLKALITTLVIGSSSVAFAGTDVRDHRTHTTTTVVHTAPAPVAPIAQPSVTVTASRTDRLAVKPVPASWRRPIKTWTTLANDAKVDGRMVLELGAYNRQFSRLSLRADGNGRTKLDRVMIVFGNGERQIVELDAKLNKSSAALSIDLQGNTRNIDKIILVGKSNRNASLDVLAL